MQIIEKSEIMSSLSASISRKGLTLSFVPTMGALHRGHLSLIEIAKNKADITIVSIYVNPLQFAPHEDFDSYPRSIDSDLKKCEELGVDIVFLPSTQEMYPLGESFKIDVGEMGAILDGVTRPHFFGGVATVVAKLFNIIKPDFAVFGQKDLQQSLIIRKLVRDFNFDIDIITAPIIREGNGLAMSSRNEYLNKEDREKAGVIFTSLQKAVGAIMEGERERKRINAVIIKHIREFGNLNIDYVQAVSANDLSSPDTFLPGEEVALLIAVYAGRTRLIDNTIVKIPNGQSDTEYVGKDFQEWKP